MRKDLKRDIYQEITDELVSMLERGVKPWRAPWDAKAAKFDSSVLPVRENGELYKGINILILWAAALKRGYEQHVWMTYKQAEALGGQVRRGEKGTSVVYYGQAEKKEKDIDGKVKDIKFSFLKSYTVFNVAQIEGLDLSKFVKGPPQNIQSVEYFGDAGAKIYQQGSQAFYTNSRDTVTMPDASFFKSQDHFTAVLSHEMIHWTGAELRLGRDLSGEYGSEAYAREELVAEIGASFLCAHLGVNPDLREQNASYIDRWLKVLKEDKRAIFQASSAAAKGAEYIKAAAIQRKTLLRDREISKDAPEVFVKTGYTDKQLKDTLHLCELVHFLSESSGLKDKFAMVGGLALNTIYLPMPRISPDIDINFVGKVPPSLVNEKRAYFERELYRAMKCLGYDNTYSPRNSWGGKYLFHNEVRGKSFEIDVSYVHREPLFPVEQREFQVIGGLLGNVRVPVKSLEEVVASKVCAETMRLKPRDALDVFNISKAFPGIFETEKFRVSYITELLATGFNPWADHQRGIVVYEKDFGKYFAPVVNKEILALNPREYSREVSVEASRVLESVTKISEKEMTFFEGVYARGEVLPSLLTSSDELQRKIKELPAVRVTAEISLPAKDLESRTKTTSCRGMI
jgi:antirestriction protein ArdC/predicted nucleotidyltransferase component of viral defense system